MKTLLLRLPDKNPLLAWSVPDDLTREQVKAILRQAKEQKKNPVKVLDKTFTPVSLMVVDV